MARLPVIGADADQWGTLLNDFLRVAHHEDGTLRGVADVINVRDFGATGTGETNDSQAFRDAIEAAVDPSSSRGNRAIFVPKGRYLLNESGVLSHLPTAIKQYGIHWFGEGWSTSTLVLNPQQSTPTWFYDSNKKDPPSKEAYANLTFADLSFESSNQGGHQDQANGFLINSAGHDQGFRWQRCFFGHETTNSFQTLLRLDGTVNADSMKFFDCRIFNIQGSVVTWNNPQAINIEFFGTDIENVTGNVFVVEGSMDGNSGGGGGLNVFGGSIIWGHSSQDSYLVKLTGSNHLSHFFSFRGIKTEMHEATAKLILKSLGYGGARIIFDSVDFVTVGPKGNVREAVTVDIRTDVAFIHCRIPNEWSYRLTQTTGGEKELNSPGSIQFQNCIVPENLSERITFDHLYGTASATNCIALDNALTTGHAIDFDRNWQNRTFGGRTIRVKVAVLKNKAAGWPRVEQGTPGSRSNMGDTTTRLPEEAIIKAIYIHKPAAGGSSAPYQLHVGVTINKQLIILGSSTLAQMKDAHTIIVENDATRLMPLTSRISETSKTSDRIIHLWADPGGDASLVPNLDGEVAILEYY